jgi:UDP-GlcNAc:undecaprenyl-phosphate GlcNAc-1-phosphate transferase
MLYCFSGFLCGAVLLGVALRSEFLALIMGIFGCLAFLVVLTSRRDELTNLRGDFQDRLLRGRQERQAAKLTWEAIQRIELCETGLAAFRIVEHTAQQLGCDRIQISCISPDLSSGPAAKGEIQMLTASDNNLSGSGVVFRLSSGEACWITVQIELGREPELATDIVFRYIQRLSQALAGRLDWLQSIKSETSGPLSRIPQITPAAPLTTMASVRQSQMGKVATVLFRVMKHKSRRFCPEGQVPPTRLHIADTVTAPTSLARR